MPTWVCLAFYDLSIAYLFKNINTILKLVLTYSIFVV